MKTSITIAFLGLWILPLSLNADYLQVSRSATLKESPFGQALVLDRVEEGDYLILLEDQQQNGYFFAKNPETNISGWIYRTLVRRFEGEIPVFPPGSTVSSANLEITVIDVGAGLCTVIKLPDGRFVLYDAGHYRGYGNTTYKQIQEVIPPGSTIELMVLSHTDADHIGAASQVIEGYRVRKVLHTGYVKSNPTATYSRFVNSLNNVEYPVQDINLHARDSIITPGVTLDFDQARLLFLCGFGTPLPEWGLTNDSEKINSVSIVMRLEYAGRSVLFCGDAVGRHIGGPDNSIMATEKFMIDNASAYLDSDILIAPHHGADNGSSMPFIEAVTPRAVIFSAGHDYEHPRQATADRYLRYVSAEAMYRTDRGDDERQDERTDGEWALGRIPGCADSYGDDDIRITINEAGSFRVNYISQDQPCEVQTPAAN